MSKEIKDFANTVFIIPKINRSQRFKEMLADAELYYTLVQSGRTSDNDIEVANLREKLLEFELKYSNDVAFVAFLKLERLKK